MAINDITIEKSKGLFKKNEQKRISIFPTILYLKEVR